jgi:hypothetical protein
LTLSLTLSSTKTLKPHSGRPIISPRSNHTTSIGPSMTLYLQLFQLPPYRAPTWGIVTSRRDPWVTNCSYRSEHADADLKEWTSFSFLLGVSLDIRWPLSLYCTSTVQYGTIMCLCTLLYIQSEFQSMYSLPECFFIQSPAQCPSPPFRVPCSPLLQRSPPLSHLAKSL